MRSTENESQTSWIAVADPISERAGVDQPEGSDPEYQNSGTSERICPQELGKDTRAPMIRWGEVCAEEDTLTGEIQELHRGEEIGRPFGRRSHAARTKSAPDPRSYLARGRNLLIVECA